jgi:leader peptidase (prepilin peptidase)/N-methyltransferase
MQYLFCVTLGYGVGMMVNYISDILPYKRKIVYPFCVHCGNKQTLRDYFIWPRHCKTCGKYRSIRVWIVEAVFTGLSLWLWLFPPDALGFSAGMLLLAYFGVVTVIDIEHRLILHPVSIFGAIVGFGVGVWLHGIQATLLGGVFGFGCMLILYFIGILFVRLLARQRDQNIGDAEGLGFGDVNLGGVIGLILGWPGIVGGLVLAILLAGAVSFAYLLIMLFAQRYQHGMSLPYGPFMVASAVILLYFQGTIFTGLGW